MTWGRGRVRMLDLVSGEKVLTLDKAGNKMWTIFEDRTYINGTFSVREFHFDPTSTEVSGGVAPSPLVVTDNHEMIISNGQNNSYKVVKAEYVKPGDVVWTGGGALKEILSTKVSHRVGKVDVVTQDCTVLANGVYTTTSCDNKARSIELMKSKPTTPTRPVELGDFSPQIRSWIDAYRAHPKTLRKWMANLSKEYPNSGDLAAPPMTSYLI